MRHTRLMLGALSIVAALAVASAALGQNNPNGNGNADKQGAPAAAPAKLSAKAALNIGQVKGRVKGTQAGASGRFTATVTPAADGTAAMTWKLTYRQLSGPALQAHIHLGARGVNGAVEVTLCDDDGGTTAAACTSGMTGNAVLTAVQLTALKKGQHYVNVHTQKNPAAEIRGQISTAPIK